MQLVGFLYRTVVSRNRRCGDLVKVKTVTAFYSNRTGTATAATRLGKCERTVQSM